ncbi:MAG: hypothetical protein E7050_05890 [Lentisphaerae bacterium]|nr:hypothetical protein [Lentisphaerota bacterium]
MKKKLILSILFFCCGIVSAAPAHDNPLWQTWEDTPMIREWKKLVAEEAWKNNTIGVDHDVPVPWIPLKIDGTTVSVWGRDYIFDGKALPVQLISQKENILAGPVYFAALINGKWVKSTPGSGKITEFFDDYAVYTGSTEIAGIPVKTRFKIEFDGFVWMELEIGAAPGNVKIDRLVLDFPVNKDVARNYLKPSDTFTRKDVRERWGQVTGNGKLGALNPGWTSIFSLGNEKVGISFCSEGVDGWQAKKFDRRVEWLVNDGEVTARFNFVDNPPAGRMAAAKIEMGFNMMPYRQLDRKLMANFIYSWDASGWAYDEIVKSPSPAVRIVSPYFVGLDEVAKRPSRSDSCAPASIPIPRNPERFMNFMAKARKDKPGTRIVYYTVGDLHTDYDPVFIDNSAAWKGGTDKLDVNTVYEFLRKKRGTLRRICGWNKDLQDYKVFLHVYWAEKLGLDGYYWDDQVYTSCLNPDHPEHNKFDCNGKSLVKRPVRAYREMAKRIYKAIKKRNPDAVFIGHVFPPYVPFSDMVIDGEVLRRLSGDHHYYTRFVKPEDVAHFYFASRVDGSAKSLLPEYFGDYYTGEGSKAATNAMFSFLWMTDMNVWFCQCNAKVLLHRFVHPRGEFGVHEAEYLPYHRQKMAIAESENVYCTVYRKPDKVLIVVSNWNTKPVKDLLTVNLEELFPGKSTGTLYNLKASFLDTKKPVKMSLLPAEAACAAEINVEIPAEDFLLIEIK